MDLVDCEHCGKSHSAPKPAHPWHIAFCTACAGKRPKRDVLAKKFRALRKHNPMAVALLRGKPPEHPSKEAKSE